MKIIRALVVAMCLSTTGCGFLSKVEPVVAHVSSVADQAAQILDMLQMDMSTLPLSDDLRAQLNKGIGDARQALVVLYGVLSGVDNLTDEQADRALNDFREAWNNLVPLLKEAGLMQAADKLGAHPDVRPIPQPLALKRFSRS